MKKIMENKDKKAMFVSVAELAKILGISHVAVFKRIKKGQISAQKVGRAYVISMEEVNNLTQGLQPEIITEEKKEEIKNAVEKVVREYGETLKLLGKE